MLLFLKKIRYGFYMIGLHFSGLLIPLISKFKGEEAAEKFVNDKTLAWAKFTIRTIGMEVKYKGLENIPKEPCVFIGNHQSILDIPLLITGVDAMVGFIAKQEMLKVPIAGRWIKLTHSIGLDRENPREAIRVINEGVENLKKGYKMAIYPEGTRARDGKIREFKKGSLKLATKANVPIIPIVVDGSYKAYELEKKFKPAVVKVTFCKPIYPGELAREEQKNLSEIVHDIIEEKLNK